MGIYIPNSILLPNFVFDAIQFFSRATILKNRLIELKVKHKTCFWLRSDEISSTHCKIFQICHRGKALTKKLLNFCLLKQEAVLMVENYDGYFSSAYFESKIKYQTQHSVYGN